MSAIPAPTGQSPIDIETRAAAPDPALPALEFAYPAGEVPALACFEIKDGDPTDDGVAIVPQVVVKIGSDVAHVRHGTKRYDLDSFHWHTPSEHWVDGRPLPLEAHLVHRSSDGGHLVVGVLSRTGSNDETIAAAFDVFDAFAPDRLESAGSQQVEISIALNDLLPLERASYRYGGSLTTAPFTEGVTWVVFTDMLEASAEQIAAHHDLVSAGLPAYLNRPNPDGNARPIQDLAGRCVGVATG